MDIMKAALLGDKDAQENLMKRKRLLPCHVCGKKAKREFREGLYLFTCSDKNCNSVIVAELDWMIGTRMWNERPEILTAEEIEKLEELK